MPAMSSTAKMPIAIPKSVSARSTCSGVAPSSTRNCASYMYGNIIRLPTKPRQLPTTTGTLPVRLPNASAVASTSGAVFAPRTTSSSRMMCAGLKKCRPTTSCGRPVAPARASMSSVDVLLARTAPGLATASSSRKMCFFSSRFSKTASMTRSAVATPS